jgi:outer membrane protein OmpA-like peptidoglycan-associated protein
MPTLSRRIAITLLVSLGTACGSSSGPPPQEKAKPSEPATPAVTKPSSSSPEIGELAAAFSLNVGQAVPEGLTPGGDCPPPGPGAEQEVTAQAAATVPLKEGLTLAYVWTRTPQEEYECLIQITKIDSAAIDTTASCNMPGNEGRHPRRVCRADLRSARMLHTLYGAVKVLNASGEEEPETIVGATAFSVSSDDFAKLKQTGSLVHRYVELASSDRLAKDGGGEMRVEGKETMGVIVNDRPIQLPVIKLRGHMKWWIRGQHLETEDTAVVLDDERFPLWIDQQSSNENTRSRIQFAKITYPNKGSGSGDKGGDPLNGGGSGGGSVEGGLLRNRRVDVYGIYFDFNSDKIREESEPVLQEIGEAMTRHPEWRISVDGHTDNIGGNGEANLRLSQRRSEAVRKALVTRFGITADRLTSGGHGAAAPKDTNDTPEGRARNRRVELVLQ